MGYRATWIKLEVNNEKREEISRNDLVNVVLSFLWEKDDFALHSAILLTPKPVDFFGGRFPKFKTVR